jgi:hypothetical protein
MAVLLRRAARAAAVLTIPLVSIAAVAPASAAPPVSWNQPEGLSTLDTLLLIVGAPLALMVVITLLVMAPSIAKGTNQRTHVPWYAEPMTFGTTPADESSTDADTAGMTGGGASVRW